MDIVYVPYHVSMFSNLDPTKLIAFKTPEEDTRKIYYTLSLNRSHSFLNDPVIVTEELIYILDTYNICYQKIERDKLLSFDDASPINSQYFFIFSQKYHNIFCSDGPFSSNPELIESSYVYKQFPSFLHNLNKRDFWNLNESLYIVKEGLSIDIRIEKPEIPNYIKRVNNEDSKYYLKRRDDL